MSPAFPRRVGALLAACAALAATGAPAAVADSDEPDLSEFDVRPPDEAWRASIGLDRVSGPIDGSGVTVAVLDTGVVRHPDLGDRMVARLDLTPDADGDDRYGHGAHMTGLIAGDGRASEGRYAGAAPDARVLTVKVAGWNGATDVSQVLAGLEWIGAHRHRYGIRVVNLSYGTDSSQKGDEDPLNRAVQRLAAAGVLVVVSAGNRGDGGSKIDKPGDDPAVLTVGAADTRNTADPADDEVAPFSSRGPTHDSVAKPDLVAPGVSLPSLRVADGTLDVLRPAARLGDAYFKGTGSSQAAAIVSGIAARLFEAQPSLSAAAAKAILVSTAGGPLAGAKGAGAGLVDAAAAVAAASAPTAPVVAPPAVRSTGLGALDSSRGSFKPYTDWKERGKPEQLSGEVDALGNPWSAAGWASKRWTPGTWLLSPWARHASLATGWDPAVAGAPWSGLGWDESSWTARSWGDAGLPGTDWTARSWGAAAWNGAG